MTLRLSDTSLSFDDTGGPGRLLVLLPGAGDLRSEYRFLTDALHADGHRVVVADLPGHGDSPVADRYTVASTADALVDLVRGLDAGPAVVIATSFAPAAAVWAAADHPDLIAGIVAISPHLYDDRSATGRLQGAAIRLLLRGRWAGGLWARLYRGWYKAAPPDDLEAEIARLRQMLAVASRRRAVRETLTADRDGVADHVARLAVPTLTVFGSADDHFAEPGSEAVSVAEQLGGHAVMVDGAGHYPHVERPDVVLAALRPFLATLG